MATLIKKIVLWSLFLLLVTTAHANFITNGGFESGTDPPTDDFRTLNAGDDSFDNISGWVVTGSVDWKNPYWIAQEGEKSLDLSGSYIGAISTTFDTIPGGIYTVTFYMSGNFDHNNRDGNPLYKRLRVSAAGASQTFYFDRPDEWSTKNMGWTQKTWTFTADNASAHLTFASLDNNAFGPALDNVVVTLLPSSVLLLGTVLLRLGAMGWRRRKA